MTIHPAAPAPPQGYRGAFRTDLEARAVYAEAAGIGRVLPRAVAVPADADDVVALTAWAHATRTPLVPRGAGSSMAGGAIGPGVIVDLGRLDWVGPVDALAMRLRAGPGATRARVQAAAAAVGLRFPVDPSSGAFCTVGGMTATNAAGAHSLRYGAMRPWVQAVDCVFADGTRATVRRGEPLADVPALRRFTAIAERLRHGIAPKPGGVRKDSSGYALDAFARSGDLVDLLVGSEGTLALFVGLELRLAPRACATSTVLAAFRTLEQAVEAAMRADGLGASACELLERTFLDVAAEGGSALPVPPNTEAVLLAETEGRTALEAGNMARLVERAFLAVGATQVTVAFSPSTEHALWELRHRASPTLARLHPQLASVQVIEDGAVPPARLPSYVRGVRAALERQGLRGVIFGHAGDAHVHVNPLVDVRQPGWRERLTALFEEVVALTERLGGTMAGEHGDGQLRTPLLPRLRGEATMARYRLLKDAFDPHELLNPGVKLPLPGQQPIGDIKYDPELPPLPLAARLALDRVARQRRYAEPRLALLEQARRTAGSVASAAAPTAAEHQERVPPSAGVEDELGPRPGASEEG